MAKPFAMLKSDAIQEKTRILVILACGASVNNPAVIETLMDLVRE